ncbi:MAG: hypothetical protein Q8940_07380 [Bacteroidota bacterium]|nr:hypothetical protein [Bacteroidota bacterium]
MFENIKWWVSFQNNQNFWDWVRDTYSTKELELLSKEVLDTSLIEVFNSLEDKYFVNGKPSQVVLNDTIKKLYKHYGSEIWTTCFGAGNYDHDNGPTGLECLSKLKLSFQVYNQTTFEEFLVRNALKYVAEQLLIEINSTNKA